MLNVGAIKLAPPIWLSNLSKMTLMCNLGASPNLAEYTKKSMSELIFNKWFCICFMNNQYACCLFIKSASFHNSRLKLLQLEVSSFIRLL